MPDYLLTLYQWSPATRKTGTFCHYIIPFLNHVQKPRCFHNLPVIYWPSPHYQIKKKNVPRGVIPTRPLAVFLCLYVEYDFLCIEGKEGFGSHSSVHSIMTRVFAKKRKELGNVERTCCRVGHLMMNCNSRDSRWVQVVVILLTSAEDTPIKSLSMSTSSPRRRRSKVTRSSCFIVRSR